MQTIVKCECAESERLRQEMVEVAAGMDLSAVRQIDQLQARLTEMCERCKNV